jgi:putative spermidine/putrescine transport system ATP-binding protein
MPINAMKRRGQNRAMKNDLISTSAVHVATTPADASKPKMRAQGLSKRYGATQALHPVDLDVRSGELLTLLGPSGSGKTTLLQLICGLVEPSSGRLFIDGHDRTEAATHERDIGVVFQNYALFPHLTVAENIAFPLQMRKTSSAEIKKKTANALEMVGLSAFGERFPRELSGGQQQRIALARCLVYQPSLLLMDESLSALDRKLRETMQIEIKRIHRELGSTIIFVTHDQEEALALSDRICLMNDGRIEQIGTPEQIYERPDTAFVADFIGISNLLRGKVGADHTLVTADGALALPLMPGAPLPATGADGAMAIRPEHVKLVDEGAGFVSGRIAEFIYAGAETRLLVKLASGAVITVRQPAGSPARGIGEAVSMRWDVGQVRFLAR